MAKAKLIESLDSRSANRLETFLDRFGNGPTYWLACHAAFPLVLTPDLLYKIWGNFKQDEQGVPVDAPLIAVADILQSSICRKIGRQAYEIPHILRQYLLAELEKNEAFQAARIKRLAEFTRYYVQECPQELPFAALQEAQHWAATAYIDPDAAARLILETLDKQEADPYSHVKLELLLSVTKQSEKQGGKETEDSSLLSVARQIANSQRAYEQGQPEEALQQLLSINELLSEKEVPEGYRTKLPEEVFERFSKEMEMRRPKNQEEFPATVARGNIPLIFLAFANSSIHPLPGLLEEEDALYQILYERSVKEGHFHLHRESYTDLNILLQYLNIYKNQIHVFHYAGHAESEQLFLSDGEAQTEGLAKLLAEQENLKLVFLSGCATNKQVSYLLEFGVPAIIATHAPIGDSMSKNFATHFYEAFEFGASIKDAFEQARAYAEAAGKKIESFQVMDFRGIGKEEPLTDEVWSLFYHPDKAEVLDYKLPAGDQDMVDKDFVPNEELINSLWETLVEEGLALERRTMKLSQKRMTILNTFPAPVAEDLRKLLVHIRDVGEGYDRIGLSRLQQINQTFETAFRIYVYGMLSILWNEISEGRIEKISDAHLDNIKRIFGYKSQSNDFGNIALELVQSIHILFQNNNIFSEFEKFFEISNKLSQEDSALLQSVRYFSYLKTYLSRADIDVTEVLRLCIQAEGNLADLLGEMTFMVHYTMLSVKKCNSNYQTKSERSCI